LIKDLILCVLTSEKNWSGWTILKKVVLEQTT
jgi:hypothetical protein